MNTRAAGRGTTTAGHRGHDRRRDDRASRRRAWEARDDAGRDLPTGVHLDQVRDLSGEPDHVGEPVVDRLQHGPVSSGWTVFRPAAVEPVVDRLQYRSSSSRRRKPSAHERTEHHVPPGTVDLPSLWTPAHRRAESGGRRGGRPQAVGNLAGERHRQCLRTGREIPTVPQRIIIDNRVRTGLVPTMATAGQCRSRGRRGRAFAIGTHLNQASSCPNHRDHVSGTAITRFLVRPDRFSAPGQRKSQRIGGSSACIAKASSIPITFSRRQQVVIRGIVTSRGAGASGASRARSRRRSLVG